MLAGCGNSQKQENEAAYLKDIDTSGYVTLGEYKGMDLALEEPEIPEEYLESYIQYVLTNNPEYVDITDRAVQTGDVVNIDYEGKLDGVAFAGGTAQGADLTIGSGQFISGFEDGCIGMEIGQTRDVEARFPDPYKNNPDLAGKTAVFTVTLNGIREVKIPELTDEYVASLGMEDCETTQEYRAFLRDILIQQQYGTPLERQYELAVEKAEADAEIKDAPEKWWTGCTPRCFPMSPPMRRCTVWISEPLWRKNTEGKPQIMRLPCVDRPGPWPGGICCLRQLPKRKGLRCQRRSLSRRSLRMPKITAMRRLTITGRRLMWRRSENI